MGCADTQSLIVRHSDRKHPHLHICINRIGNDGKTITDHNEKYRSTKICRELTERYGLTIGDGKQKVNYCCPLNFKTPQFSYPQCPSIGVADFFLEK